ncbi:hypothetical protein N7470_003994 [Penicillium chermesinum]|nr:hypothetical protein N7470_003994 [Penicillium chermesinum]
MESSIESSIVRKGLPRGPFAPHGIKPRYPHNRHSKSLLAREANPELNASKNHSLHLDFPATRLHRIAVPTCITKLNPIVRTDNPGPASVIWRTALHAVTDYDSSRSKQTTEPKDIKFPVIDSNTLATAFLFFFSFFKTALQAARQPVSSQKLADGWYTARTGAVKPSTSAPHRAANPVSKRLFCAVGAVTPAGGGDVASAGVGEAEMVMRLRR